MHPATTQMIDKEFRERVVRQAILLGLVASEEWVTPVATAKGRFVWIFEFEGMRRGHYNSLYHAALEYLRLMRVPAEITGVDVGQI